MRTALLCLCALGPTMVANSQDGVVPTRADDAPPAAVLKARQIEVGVVETSVRREGEAMVMKSRVVAKGDVEIRIGQSLIFADEAEIRYGGPGEPDDVELRGNVRLKAHLKVDHH